MIFSMVMLPGLDYYFRIMIVCLVLYFVLKILKSNDKMVNIIIIGVIAAVTKLF